MLVVEAIKEDMLSQLPVPVRKAIDAANSGDSDAFLAQFTSVTGYVNDRGREFRGIDAIRRWSDAAFIGKHVKINVINFYIAGQDEIAVIAEVAADEFNGPRSFTFGVDGELLTDLRILT